MLPTMMPLAICWIRNEEIRRVPFGLNRKRLLPAL